eukprot:CAMPEP_0172310344 /NCGR_PEP_ID=MMETSP1058-20130122/11431_1 /TAXON_ID=83371 /ORGANISM="Detonula confervacea, Strain CCMP 353" /LENGTH=385 /DNA_ID=CAMNT_0013023139 /DNA_START=95 /DNA_END=1252 /DNA_ORIENTATION=+
MVTQKQAIASCALWLASSAPVGDAFSARSSVVALTSFRSGVNNDNNNNSALMMAGFPPPMDGPNGGGSSGMGGPPGMGMGGQRSMGQRSMGGPPMGGGGGPGMGQRSMGGRGPGMGGPSMGRGPGMGQRSMGGRGPGMGQRSMGGRGMGQRSMGRGPGQQQPRGGGSYNANNPPGGPFNVPNAGNTAGQQRPDARDKRGLGGIAAGVSTPMDKYGNTRSPEQSNRRFGAYNEAGMVGGGFNNRGAGPDPRFDERGGVGGPGPRGGGFDERGGPPRGGRGDDGRPNNLRYEERDYGEYIGNLRSSTSMGSRDRGPPGPGGDYRDLEDEVERLRKENALLKRSCQDFMNNFNELSNRLFDVDETLKKVAKVFPSEDEMESLEWLLRR